MIVRLFVHTSSSFLTILSFLLLLTSFVVRAGPAVGGRGQRRRQRSLQQTNVVNVGITLQNLLGPLTNESAVVIEAETSSFLLNSIITQEAENDLLTNLFVETTLLSQQLVNSDSSSSSIAPSMEVMNQQAQQDQQQLGTWLLQFQIQINFRLPQETSTLGSAWIREAFNSDSERSDYINRLKGKTDVTFSNLSGIARVLVGGLQVDVTEPVKTEFVDVIMVLNPVMKTLKDEASIKNYEKLTSAMITDYVTMLNQANSQLPLEYLFVDASIIQQRVLLPSNYESMISSTDDNRQNDGATNYLLQNESLSLELTLDVQIDYKPSSSAIDTNAASLNVSSWVFGAFATTQQQLNYTAFLRKSNNTALAYVETVTVQAEPPTNTDSTIAPSNPSSSSNHNVSKQPLKNNPNLIGIVAGAIMLGIALCGIILFVYQQYTYRKRNAQIQSKQRTSRMNSNKNLHPSKRNLAFQAAQPPEQILEVYRDLCLGKQEDISTLGDSLGGVTSQRIIKEGDFTRVDL